MGFGQFWQHYPKKVAKADALKAWGKLTAGDEQAAIEALPAHLEHWRGTDKQFIPHAATWIRGRRWEDELPTRAESISDHEFFRINGYSRRA